MYAINLYCCTVFPAENKQFSARAPQYCVCHSVCDQYLVLRDALAPLPKGSLRRSASLFSLSGFSKTKALCRVGAARPRRR